MLTINPRINPRMDDALLSCAFFFNPESLATQRPRMREPHQHSNPRVDYAFLNLRMCQPCPHPTLGWPLSSLGWITHCGQEADFFKLPEFLVPPKPRISAPSDVLTVATSDPRMATINPRMGHTLLSGIRFFIPEFLAAQKPRISSPNS